MSFLTVTWTVTAIIHSSTSAPQGAAHSNAGAGCLCDWKTHSVSITGALLTVGRGLSQAAEMKRKLPGRTLFVYECTAGICRRLPLCCSALKTSSPQVSKGWTTKEEDTFFLFSFSGLLLCSDFCETKTVECVFFFFLVWENTKSKQCHQQSLSAGRGKEEETMWPWWDATSPWWRSFLLVL